MVSFANRYFRATLFDLMAGSELPRTSSGFCIGFGTAKFNEATNSLGTHPGNAPGV
jgi:hypothetical protein